MNPTKTGCFSNINPPPTPTKSKHAQPTNSDSVHMHPTQPVPSKIIHRSPMDADWVWVGSDRDTVLEFPAMHFNKVN